MMRHILTVIVLLLAIVPTAGWAQARQQKVVDNAVRALDNLATDQNFGAFRRQIVNAKAVLIVPELVKAGFILGGETGTGLLLVKQNDGSWSYPAFYDLYAGSLGLQIGIQTSEVVFLVMTDAGLASIRDDNIKLGADASVAVGPIGAGVEASKTINLADIYAYSKSMGLFGGGAFEGAVIEPATDANIVYYGPGATTQGILMDQQFSNAGADQLRTNLSRLASGQFSPSLQNSGEAPVAAPTERAVEPKEITPLPAIEGVNEIESAPIDIPPPSP